MAQANNQQQAPAEKLYVVKIGRLMVGQGEIRNPGDVVKASELTKAEVKYFLADGTITEKGK